MDQIENLGLSLHAQFTFHNLRDKSYTTFHTDCGGVKATRTGKCHKVWLVVSKSKMFAPNKTSIVAINFFGVNSTVTNLQ